jgi:membrane protein DedA with SNARE-associated domain
MLACAIVVFSVTVEWSAQSWLDLAAYVVSIVAVAGVLAYATSRPFGAAFFGLFRWVFVTVVATQAFVHAMETAKRHGYSMAGTAVFVLVLAVVIGWVFVLQWVALTRLAKEQ